MKTYLAQAGKVQKKWYEIDAAGHVLGRLSTQIANILRGKHRPEYTPHVDAGEFVVVVNAEKVRLTGRKWDGKRYYRHSGYPGGLKFQTAREVRNRYPERLIMAAVRNMLPNNRLGRQLLKKLKVYTGPEHPHTTQKPLKVEFTSYPTRIKIPGVGNA
ncbi:MAG: 50S ribosomal protein L13 [Deltaproteobacteria bacterium]|nr:50S ribosomal protein L13 [Deltaproteobacteria bacterium]